MKNPNSIPKDTKKHPWRNRNNKLQDFSRKELSKQKLERYLNAPTTNNGLASDLQSN